MLNSNKWYRKYQLGGVQLSPEAQELLAHILQDPLSAPQILIEALQSGKEQAVLEVAQAVPQIGLLLAQMMQSQSDSQALYAKRGTKIEKKCGGKKILFEKGAKVRKASAGCPCQLRKMGGRIVNVDCYGNILR